MFLSIFPPGHRRNLTKTFDHSQFSISLCFGTAGLHFAVACTFRRRNDTSIVKRHFNNDQRNRHTRENKLFQQVSARPRTGVHKQFRCGWEWEEVPGRIHQPNQQLQLQEEHQYLPTYPSYLVQKLCQYWMFPSVTTPAVEKLRRQKIRLIPFPAFRLHNHPVLPLLVELVPHLALETLNSAVEMHPSNQ